MAYATGLPSAAAMTTIMDALAAWYKRAWPLGFGQAGETGIALYATTAKANIVGDGSTVYGVDNPALAAQMGPDLDSLVKGSRFDVITSQNLRGLVSRVEGYMLANLPVGWSLTRGGRRAIDAWLVRLNAMHASTPAKPTGTPTASATTGGSMAPVASGSAPRMCYTWVGAYDELESQPSAYTAQVALTGANNAYTLASVQTPVPTGCTKIRCYRQKLGAVGANDPMYWDHDIAAVAGGTSPAVTFTKADAELRTDIRPPVWAQAVMLPEAAAFYAVIAASLSDDDALRGLPVTLQSNGMLDPSAVVLQATNVYLGLANPETSGVYGTRVVGTGYTAGAIQAANDYAQRLQGFAGCTKLQARVTSVLNAGASLSHVLGTYLDAAHPTTPQSMDIAGPFSLSAALGSTVEVTGLASGAVVLSVTGDTCGTAATGTYQYEGLAPRTI